jgi:hypothetical protein
MHKQIDRNDWFEDFKEGNHAAVTVDCTDFHVNETYLIEKELCSFKFNGLGFCYKISVCITTGLIVWLNCPCLPQSIVICQQNDVGIDCWRVDCG